MFGFKRKKSSDHEHPEVEWRASVPSFLDYGEPDPKPSYICARKGGGLLGSVNINESDEAVPTIWVGNQPWNGRPCGSVQEAKAEVNNALIEIGELDDCVYSEVVNRLRKLANFDRTDDILALCKRVEMRFDEERERYRKLQKERDQLFLELNKVHAHG